MQEKIYDLFRSTSQENILLAFQLNYSCGNDVVMKSLYKVMVSQKPIYLGRIYRRCITLYEDYQPSSMYDFVYENFNTISILFSASYRLNRKINDGARYGGFIIRLDYVEEIKKESKNHPFRAWSKSLP